MPTYEYQCLCGNAFEMFCSVKEHSPVRLCGKCGKDAPQVIGAVYGYVQRECHYDSPIDGRPITSWAQRRDDLARNNCREYDPEMKTDAARHRAREQDQLEKAVDDTVEREIDRMPTRKKERLANELLGGADIAPERGTVPVSTVRKIDHV